MKKSYIFILFSVLSLLLSSPTWAQSSFSDWSIVMSGKKDGNEILSFERLIKTPQSTYPVAAITMLKTRFEGKRNVDSVKEFVSKEFKLTGLAIHKLGEAWRFEGWQEVIRRQVVIMVSFEANHIKVSTSFYRPFYGRKITLETELWHRFYHNDHKRKTSLLRDLPKYFDLVPSAYADPCDRCHGNPMCVMLCRGAGAASSGSESSGSSGNGSYSDPRGQGNPMSAGNVANEMRRSNEEVARLNRNLETANPYLARGTRNHAESNDHWAQTNSELGDTNSNLRDLNSQAERANENVERALNRADALSEKADGWRQHSEDALELGERATKVAEKAMDPKHMFKVAAFSAAGAVIGASMANLAVSGIGQGIDFLIKWANGELREEEQEKLRQRAQEALKVYEETSKLAIELEKAIDGVLASMALSERFELDNSDLLPNIHKYIKVNQFKINAVKKRTETASEKDYMACAEELIPLEQELVELESIAMILRGSESKKKDGLKIKLCSDLREMFRKLAEAEGALQTARPSILAAQEALVEQTAKAQNSSAKALKKLNNCKMAKKVAKAQMDHAKKLRDRNLKDNKKLAKNIAKNCKTSILDTVGTVLTNASRKGINDEDIDMYCKSLVTSGKFDIMENMIILIPVLDHNRRRLIKARFEQNHVLSGLEKYYHNEEQREKIFEDFKRQTSDHKQRMCGLSGLLSLDPKVALQEMTSMNGSFERLAREQALLFTDGLRNKELKFEEACRGY